jgi:leucyl aminopeptidase (aminopeptidase T)
MTFEAGRVVKHTGRGIAAVMKNIGSDATGTVIGEFGIGTNRGARICKNMLEAEKAFSTVHFAIGDSYGLGKNRSRHHYDALVEKVTVVADGKPLMKNGKFVI